MAEVGTRLTTRWALRLVAVAILGLAGVGLGPRPAAAETTLDVTTPADGRFQPGSRRVPLLVTIQADRAISGTLSAQFDGVPAGSMPIEVAGGSAKEVVFIVTLPPWSRDGTISFDGPEDGDDSSARMNLIGPGGDELVAVLGDLATRDVPATATVATDIGAARLFPFDVGLLDAGPDALAPFSQVVTTGDDLDGLDADHLEAVRSWVSAGRGVLVVDDPPGRALPFELSAEPLGAGDDTFGLGLGTVVFSDGAATAGRYDGLFRPSESRSPDDFPWGGFFGGFGGGTQLLAADAGVTVPEIGSLALALVVYAIIAGPVVWLLLRRTNREPLLWLVVPAFAAVTTAGVYGFGQYLRDESATAHATLVADLPGERIVSSQVLVTSPNGGLAGVDLPDGWRSTPVLSEEMFFEGPFGPGGGLATNQQQVAGSDLVIDLPPGGVGVVAAEGVQAQPTPSWEWSLRLDDDGDLVGTITNLTAYDLEEVYVASGRGFQRITSLEAGEEADVSLSRISEPTIEGDPLMERLWQFNDPFGPGGGNNDGVANPVVLANWLGEHPEVRRPGYLVVVGWTRDAPSPLAGTAGGTIDVGRTGFLAAARLDESITAETGRIEFLRGFSTRVSDPPAPNGCSDFPMTVRLTPGRDVTADNGVLALQTRAIAALDVWDGSAWTPVGMAVAPAGALTIGLPDGALADGQAYVRYTLSCDFWGMADPFPGVRAAEPDDEIGTIGELALLGVDDEVEG